ncbi:MAG: barnase inhibitor [Cytophagaceae bacterium]|nr:MAG: barnase inhibitor [Cytophagaceae bacterium]
MTVQLLGTEMTSREALHAHLKERLGFPDYYGENLDALWDCLRADVELPITIQWLNFSASQRSLGEYADRTLATFHEAQEEVKGLTIEVK